MPESLPKSPRATQEPRASGEDAGERIYGLDLDLEAVYRPSEDAEPSRDMHTAAPYVCIVLPLPDFS